MMMAASVRGGPENCAQSRAGAHQRSRKQQPASAEASQPSRWIRSNILNRQKAKLPLYYTQIEGSESSRYTS